MTIPVIATANGYYGGKIREPGEAFAIADVEDFSVHWMDSSDAKVKSHVRKLANATSSDGDTEAQKRDTATSARHAKDWLSRGGHPDEDEPVETRRVNTGGTDGVVGAEVPKKGQKLSAKERIAAAKALTGREDIDTAKEADQILAAAETGSDNDDRSRDFASDPRNDATSPTPAADDSGDDGDDD